MKEIGTILEAYDKLNREEVKVVLATVIKVSGSSYRSPGARMLITDAGHWVGSISGGCLEGDALRKARNVIREGKPSLVRYDTREDESGMALGLGCNGIIDVLLEPIREDSPTNPINILRDLFLEKKAGAHALVYKTDSLEGVAVGDRVCIDDQIESSIADTEIGEEVIERLKIHQDKRSSRTEKLEFGHGNLEVFFEVIEPPVKLLIFGGGFDVKPVTEFAARLGWEIGVTDECIAHTAPALFPEATHVAQCNTEQILQKFEITPYTAAVVMSHNYKYDKAVLGQLLTQDVRYIGVLGPRSRFDKIIDELKSEGVPLAPKRIDKVNSPIGLDIGAETPDEIAVSIVSEIKAVFSGRDGSSLKERDEPIHKRHNDTDEIFKPQLAL